MITVSLPDLRHRFGPMLDHLDDLTLVPLFDSALNAFLSSVKIPVDKTWVQVKMANIAEIEDAYLGRIYKASFCGSTAEVMRRKFLAFLKQHTLEEFHSMAQHDLMLVHASLLSVEAGWFYFGTGELMEDKLPLLLQVVPE